MGVSRTLALSGRGTQCRGRAEDSVPQMRETGAESGEKRTHMPVVTTADVVVIGAGVVGCSTAYHLARNGAGKIVVLDKGPIGSGGTGRSCAIVRTHYSVPANMAHAVASLEIFRRFGETVGGDAGFIETGYLIVGPGEHRESMLSVFHQQNRLGIDTAVLTPEEARGLHPLVSFDDVDVIGYDSMAGYCDPELTTASYARRSRELGATVLPDTPVTGIDVTGEVKTLHTTAGDFEAPVVVIAAGPWTHAIGGMIDVEFPFVVSRHKVMTLEGDRVYEPTWPVLKDLTTSEKIYVRPASGGSLLVGTGDHGEPVEDPDALVDGVDQEHVARIGAQVGRLMPEYADARLTGSWTGLYDITPDWNPVVGPVPGVEGVYVAVGFSGHGFKLAPTIGESLAQTVLGRQPRVPIDPYSMSRFADGKELRGAYGVGSIA